MAKGMLHLHVAVVTLFLLFLFVKTLLLLVNHPSLQKIRDKTKVVDMVLGILILITGGYMLTVVPMETYLIVKIVITLIGIPLGIIAFRKQSKVLAIITLLAFIYVYGVAETDSWKFKPSKIEVAETPNETPQELGYQVYNQTCVTCHGENGKLGQGGAKDLTQTKLTKEQIAQIVKNGKGLMPAYKKRLSDDEISGLADYVKSLGK